MCHTLIIEDEPIIADHLADLVEEAGATSVECADAEEDAVAAARRRHPDIIVSDVKLLRGTGPAAVAAIHAELGARPVIFVTATPDACRPCDPPAVILSKPFRNSDLLREFKRLLELP